MTTKLLNEISHLRKGSILFLLHAKSNPAAHKSVSLRGFRRNSFLLDRNKNFVSDDDKPELNRFEKDGDHTWVGPAHPLSNLRLKVFPTSDKISQEEKEYYIKCKETQDWNQQYWETHNKDFEESKQSYIEKVSKEKKLAKDETLTAEDMSHFYKHFLDINYKKHIKYNWDWYGRNFSLLLLAAKANIYKLKRKLKS